MPNVSHNRISITAKIELFEMCDEASELLKEVKTVFYRGRTWFPIKHLRLLCGKTGLSGPYRKKVTKMMAAGKCIKRVSEQSHGSYEWFVREDYTQEILGIDRTVILASIFYILITKGGAKW